MATTIKNITGYIAAQPKDRRIILEKLRQTINAAAPEAEEVISYQLPAFKYHGILVYFGIWKNHIGFYPTSSATKAFEKELSVYEGAKGSVKFPLDKPIPFSLISKIVKFRVKENLSKSKNKNAGNMPLTKSKETSDPKSVTDHIRKLDPDLRKTVETIRQLILSIDKEIGERIKWNNPSFFYTGEMKPFNPKEYKREIAVFNLFKGRIMLVFPSGAVTNDTSGLLEGDYKDGRRIVLFKDIKDVKSKEQALRNVIVKWLKLVDK